MIRAARDPHTPCGYDGAGGGRAPSIPQEAPRCRAEFAGDGFASGLHRHATMTDHRHGAVHLPAHRPAQASRLAKRSRPLGMPPSHPVTIGQSLGAVGARFWRRDTPSAAPMVARKPSGSKGARAPPWQTRTYVAWSRALHQLVQRRWEPVPSSPPCPPGRSPLGRTATNGDPWPRIPAASPPLPSVGLPSRLGWLASA